MPKRIKVKVITNWCDSFSIHDRIISQYVTDKIKLQFDFTDSDDYDYLVIFNDKKGYIPKVSKDKIIGFIQEPPDHNFFDKNIGNYCKVVYTCADPKYYQNNANFVGFPCGMFYHLGGEVEEYFQPIEKTLTLSMITSGIKGGFYDNRLRLSKAVKYSGIGDVFGRGNRYGTELPPDGKQNGLLPYKFSICMENGIWDGYISDKIIDAVMCNAIPIYVGAPDIKKHMPFAIELTQYQNIPAAIDEIKHIVQTTDYYAVLPKLQEWKFKFLKRYSLLKKITDFVNENS